MDRLPNWILLMLVVTGISTIGCVGPIKHKMSTDYPAAVIYPIGTPPVIDGRARFREIFCQLLAAEPDFMGTDGVCENFLLRLNDETLPGSRFQPLSNQGNRYRVLIVPGFLNECFAGIALPFEDAIQKLNEQGFKIDELVVSGYSSSDTNAKNIAETVDKLNLDENEKLVFIGHSKGAVDLLHFLVNYPQMSKHVAAVVSVAGAINGSRLVTKADNVYTDIALDFLSKQCDTTDEAALHSLRPTVRLSWLAANPLPKSVRYFSLAALTKRENINTLLKNSYDHLSVYSPRNDGLLLMVDQMIPGGTLLGYANVDHLSVVLPLESNNFIISETIQAPQNFPRKVLLQAILAYVAEALDQKREQR
jgi:hypothetical protein